MGIHAVSSRCVPTYPPGPHTQVYSPFCLMTLSPEGSLKLPKCLKKRKLRACLTPDVVTLEFRDSWPLKSCVSDMGVSERIGGRSCTGLLSLAGGRVYRGLQSVLSGDRVKKQKVVLWSP